MATRMEYCASEDRKIVSYIAHNNAWSYVRGNKIWQVMEKEKVVPNRTYHSLRNRFIKNIEPRLSCDFQDILRSAPLVGRLRPTDNPRVRDLLNVVRRAKATTKAEPNNVGDHNDDSDDDVDGNDHLKKNITNKNDIKAAAQNVILITKSPSSSGSSQQQLNFDQQQASKDSERRQKDLGYKDLFEPSMKNMKVPKKMCPISKSSSIQSDSCRKQQNANANEASKEMSTAGNFNNFENIGICRNECSNETGLLRQIELHAKTCIIGESTTKIQESQKQKWNKDAIHTPKRRKVSEGKDYVEHKQAANTLCVFAALRENSQWPSQEVLRNVANIVFSQDNPPPMINDKNPPPHASPSPLSAHTEVLKATSKSGEAKMNYVCRTGNNNNCMEIVEGKESDIFGSEAPDSADFAEHHRRSFKAEEVQRANGENSPKGRTDDSNIFGSETPEFDDIDCEAREGFVTPTKQPAVINSPVATSQAVVTSQGVKFKITVKNDPNEIFGSFTPEFEGASEHEAEDNNTNAKLEKPRGGRGRSLRKPVKLSFTVNRLLARNILQLTVKLSKLQRKHQILKRKCKKLEARYKNAH